MSKPVYFTRGLKASNGIKTVTITTEIHDDGFMITTETDEIGQMPQTDQISRSTLTKALNYITSTGINLMKEGYDVRLSTEKPHKVIYDLKTEKFKISI